METVPGPDAPLEERVLHALRTRVTPTLPQDLAETLRTCQALISGGLDSLLAERKVF